MTATRPPFRADHVGSLLRPPAVRDARIARAEGRIDTSALREIEDEAIRNAIARQCAIGLRAVTDGEYRRAFWHFDFLQELDGVELVDGGTGIQFKGAATRPKMLKVTGRIDFAGHPMLDHFAFVRDNAGGAVAKQTIPSPSVLHFRGGRQAVDPSVYPDMDGFFEDLGNAYRKAVGAFADAGCRYLQLDETNIAYLCDPDQVEALRQRGEQVDGLLQTYADLINTAIAGRPDDMAVTCHLCRGNFRSSWIASGGYEPVAEVLFGGIAVDGFFLEYDSERAGGFEPLRYMPADSRARVVLGLVTSKTGELESRDDVRRRIDEAARHVPLERLALSPQCGFASTEEGNLLGEDEQWRKLEFVVSVAEEVWGTV